MSDTALNKAQKDALLVGLKHLSGGLNEKLLKSLLVANNYDLRKCTELVQSINSIQKKTRKRKKKAKNGAGAENVNQNTNKANKETKQKTPSVQKPSKGAAAPAQVQSKGAGPNQAQAKATETKPPIRVPKNAPNLIRERDSEKNISKLKKEEMQCNYKLIVQKSDPLNRIKDFFTCNIRVMVLMRGCPGSGKTTCAKDLLKELNVVDAKLHLFSTDDFFNEDGQYVFNQANLTGAHLWNKIKVTNIMKLGVSPIIVDNTNIQIWQMKPYVESAIKYGYEIEVLEPKTPWFFNESILAMKTVHKVGKQKISQLLSVYDANVTGQSLKQSFNCKYHPGQTPPMASVIADESAKKVVTDMTKKRCNYIVNEKKDDKKGDEQNIGVNMHKSSSLRNIAIGEALTEDEECKLKQLNDLFPEISNTILESTFRMCNGDLNLIIATLLDTNNDFLRNNVNEEDDSDSLSSCSVDEQPTELEGKITTEEIEVLKSLFPDLSEADINDCCGKLKPDFNFNDIYCVLLEKTKCPIIKETPNSVKKVSTSDKPSVTSLEKQVSELSLNSENKIRLRLNNSFGNIATFCDNFTNTNYLDFTLLKDAQSGDVSPNKVVVSKGDFKSGSDLPIVPRRDQVLKLDKGTSTVDVNCYYKSQGQDCLDILTSMFPAVHKGDLEELLTSCVGDLNWAVGILIDSGLEISPTFNAPLYVQQSTSDLSMDSKNNESSEEIKSKSVINESQEPIASGKKDKKKKNKVKAGSDNVNIRFVMNDDSCSDFLKNKMGKANKSVIVNEKKDTLKELEMNPDKAESATVCMPFSFETISKLQKQFGGLIPKKCIDGPGTQVELPMSLARQLHSYVMDSLLNSSNNATLDVLEEDEMLAEQLQKLENELALENNDAPSTFQEIMDQELALKIHKSINKQPGKGNTMAGMLARQLLIERYPSMDPVSLRALLEDTSHSLHKATHLLDAAGISPSSILNPSPTEIKVEEEESMSHEEAVEQAEAYRQTAQELSQMRKECLTKAKIAFREGRKSVASYYSQMAQWHDERIVQTNILASSTLLKGNMESDTLDLHFLRVREAICILDLFLDAQIRNLVNTKSKSRSKELYIITGRGLHSDDGKSKIKPSVSAKLKQRNIRFNIVNPGMLKVLINENHLITCQA